MSLSEKLLIFLREHGKINLDEALEIGFKNLDSLKSTCYRLTRETDCIIAPGNDGCWEWREANLEEAPIKRWVNCMRCGKKTSIFAQKEHSKKRLCSTCKDSPWEFCGHSAETGRNYEQTTVVADRPPVIIYDKDSPEFAAMCELYTPPKLGGKFPLYMGHRRKAE